MSKEILQLRNFSLFLAERHKAKIEELGACCRIVSDGNGVPDLHNVIVQALLALRLGEEIINPAELTPLENRLMSEIKEGKEQKILVISDFDGVLVSPFHTVYKVAKEVLTGVTPVQDTVKEMRKKGKISPRSARDFARIIRASDKTVFWTSRFRLSENDLKKIGLLDELYELFRGTVSYFPFMDAQSVKRMEEFGREKMKVVTNKPLGSAAGELSDLIRREKSEITYYIGSSEKDRIAVEAMLRQHPELAESFVFFDACHLFL